MNSAKVWARCSSAMTKCLNCGRVLTDEKGKRLQSAHFDSFLPVRRVDNTTVWARCSECYLLACRLQGKE